MRERVLIHVDGPRHAGKTTFIERVLDAEVAFSVCVRAVRDAALRKEQVSAPKNQPELRRYRDRGAAEVALYRFAERNVDAFFMSDFMQEYSEAVFIEGDLPLDFVDLSVFIAPIPAAGHSLLRRIRRDHTAAHEASLAQLTQALDDPEALARLLGGAFGEALAGMVRARPGMFDDTRRAMRSKLAGLKGAPAPEPTEHWALAEGHEGIERAQLVVANIRHESERPAAAALLEELARLRKDETIFADVVGRRGNKLPITTVVADLSNAKDAGLKKALARVKRATKRSSR